MCVLVITADMYSSEKFMTLKSTLAQLQTGTSGGRSGESQVFQQSYSLGIGSPQPLILTNSRKRLLL